MRVAFSNEVTHPYRVFILVFMCLQLFQNILLDLAKVVLLVLVQTDQSGFDADHLQIAVSSLNSPLRGCDDDDDDYIEDDLDSLMKITDN